MATWYLRRILSTQSRSTLKMQGFEPSIDLDFENFFCFLKKVSNLKTVLFVFLAFSDGVTAPCKIQSIELAAILVVPSFFQNFFLGPLRAPKEPPGRGKSSVLASSSPRSSAEQIGCIFAMDYGALGPPTL